MPVAYYECMFTYSLNVLPVAELETLLDAWEAFLEALLINVEMATEAENTAQEACDGILEGKYLA